MKAVLFQPTVDSAFLFLDQAAGEGKRLQELPSRRIRFCFSQVSEYLQEAVALVQRQPQQLPAHTFHHLHRGVTIDFVVFAAVEEPEGVGNQPGKSRHKRIHRSHPRNLADPYDSKGAISRGMSRLRASRRVSV
ncbi:hypothetical protein SUDANB60_03439 [Streptomyces sp. enrichment culture]